MSERTLRVPLWLRPGGIADVLLERGGQVLAGFTVDRDDALPDGDLAAAAMAYVVAAYQPPGVAFELDFWPFAPAAFKPRGRRDNLVRATALLVAEIDRLDRAAQPRAVVRG